MRRERCTSTFRLENKTVRGAETEARKIGQTQRQRLENRSDTETEARK